MIPRGIRNNNPGNIERGAPWNGLAGEDEIPAELLGETRFAVFRAPHWGIRAIARILRTYKRHGIGTIRQVISRWAPPIENDTDAYIRFVADFTGRDADEALDLTEFADVEPLVRALIRFENGEQPYTAEVIERGLEAAEVKPPPRFMV